MKEIMLPSVIRLKDPALYKGHFAVFNQYEEPLDVFLHEPLNWHRWNTWKGVKDHFNRPYIFSVVSFYPEENTWLFAGIYKVLSNKGKRYTIKLQPEAAEYIGRLKLRYKLQSRNTRIKLDKVYSDITVSEILPDVYSGKTFPGYEDINISFREIKDIVDNQRKDWLRQLSHVNGIYLITDTKNGKKYVGSAYGVEGVWSRWKQYAHTGHGGNKELKRVIAKRGINYAIKNFVFTLIEFHSKKVDKEEIFERECFWKESLLSRGDYGYNKN